MEQSDWHPEEEQYLKDMCAACVKLAAKYRTMHDRHRVLLHRLKIPAIVVGSASGVASFGAQQFPPILQKHLAIGVGIVSVAIAILNTLESYFKVGEVTAASEATIRALQRLRDDIHKELQLPMHLRSSDGITFLRDAYVRYQQIIGEAPLPRRSTVDSRQEDAMRPPPVPAAVP